MSRLAKTRNDRSSLLVIVGVFFLTLSGIGAGAVGANSAPVSPDVVRQTLANGLRVIIVRNTLAPVVSTAVNYQVGSDEAPEGFPGMAHAQEHMMFRGSPGLSADQLANIGSIMGGNFNADTQEGLTQYLYTVPSEDLDVALHVEALRMRGVLDQQQEWDKERGAIEQEVAQDLSNPSYVLYEKLRAALFANSPHAHDALGTRASFDQTSAEMLRRFHDAWYAPNNAILIIVGNLDPQTTLRKVAVLFGDIPPKKLPPRPAIVIHPAKPESFTISTDSSDVTQVLALQMAGIDSPDFPAVEVLADILASHRFDLYGLVPQGKAIRAEFALEPLTKASFGYAEVVFPAGQDPKAVEREIRAILQNVALHGVPADLVEAAKIQERREAAFQTNSISDLALVWSDAVALYGLRYPMEDLERIEKVSVADVNRVAQKYLTLDHAVSAVMLPQESGKVVLSTSGFGGQESIALGEATPAPLPAWAQSTLAHVSVPPSTIHPVVKTLPNGLTLIIQPEDISDTVTVFGHTRNRPDTEEPVGKEGISLVLDRLFHFGSTHLDRIAFEQALDAIGASESAGTDFGVKILAPDFDRGVALLADNELNPALPLPAIDILRRQIAQTVEARNKSPDYLMLRSVRSGLYPPDDPSLRQATALSVSSITPKDVLAYYARVFRPDLTTIVVIGKVSPANAEATINKYFGAWTAAGPVPPTDLPVTAPNHASVAAIPDVSRVQDRVFLAQTLGLFRSDSDYYALALGNAVLGGGFYSSRFSNDLRKNSGLVYSVDSDLEVGRTRGIYLIQYACDPRNVTTAENMIVRELDQIRTKPVDDDEFTRAKAILIRQIALEEASVDAIAHGLSKRHDLNLPLDEPTFAAQRYIALTPQAVQEAFEKWVRPADVVRASQGPLPQ